MRGPIFPRSPSAVLPTGDLCITVIPAPEPESHDLVMTRVVSHRYLNASRMVFQRSPEPRTHPSHSGAITLFITIENSPLLANKSLPP